MSVAERYIRATRSSHLKLEPEAGDVDMIIAAGIADSLGTLLLRCRQEWDSQRAQLEQAEENRQAGLAIAHQAERAAKPVVVANAGPCRPEEFERAMADAAKVRENVDNEALTSRMLILMNMTSLRPTSNALMRYALQRAARRKMMLERAEVAVLVGQSLDVWLDQRCNACAGRGFNGGYGAPNVLCTECTECRGTKKRKRPISSKGTEANELGGWLLAESDRLVDAAQRRMHQALR